MTKACLNAVVLVSALLVPTGCEAIASLRGLVGAAKEIGEHLEKDLKAELTDDKITKVIDVTPKLKEFSKTAKVKWEVDPNAPDFSKLASALGGLSDYIAFFEGEGTRLTEYYVDVVKIQDARGLITMRKAHEEATKKLADERKEIETKLAAATGDAKKPLEEELARNEQAKKTLDEARAAQLTARDERSKQPSDGGYQLSDDEIARVEARIADIDAAFEKGGYEKAK
jgi:hypothetical protein